jgi:hypothetical protein
MSATQALRELIETMRPQDRHGDGTGLRSDAGEHGGDYPDNIPQAITVTDAQAGGLRTFRYESAARSSCQNRRLIAGRYQARAKPVDF